MWAPMLDLRLRPLKERALGGLTAAIAPKVPAAAVTAAALAVTLGAAALAWSGRPGLALVAWLAGRLLDGLDGPVARRRGEASDWGGYLDIVADTVGYAAVPIGVALGIDRTSGWITVSLLLGAFFVNTVSWAFQAAVLEKRGAGADTTGEMTTVTMPPALVEGTETIVLFSLFVGLPALAPWFFSLMAALVSVNVLQRLWWARRALQ